MANSLRHTATRGLWLAEAFLIATGLFGLWAATGCAEEPERNAPPVGSGSGSGSEVEPSETEGEEDTDTDGGTGWQPIDCDPVCDPANLESDPVLLEACDCLCEYECTLTPIGGTEGEREDRSIELACGLQSPFELGDSWIVDCSDDEGTTGDVELTCDDLDSNGIPDLCQVNQDEPCECEEGSTGEEEQCLFVCAYLEPDTFVPYGSAVEVLSCDYTTDPHKVIGGPIKHCAWVPETGNVPDEPCAMVCDQCPVDPSVLPDSEYCDGTVTNVCQCEE